MDSDKPNKRESSGKKYDGVVFEPSYKTQKFLTQKPDTNKPDTHKSDTQKYSNDIYRSNRAVDSSMQRERERMRSLEREKKKQREARFAVIYISVLSVAVIICIVIFAFAFSSSRTNGNNTMTAAVPTNTPIPVEISTSDISRLTGQIYEIDPVEKKLKLLDINTGKRYSVTVDSLTEMKDKYGKQIVFAEYKPGLLVEAGFDAKTGKLSQLTISPNAWDIRQVKDVKIDTDNKIITFGNDKYMYDDNLLTYYQGKPYDINQIKPLDIVSMTGFNATAWCIYVEKSHGSLNFGNADKIENGNVEINTDIFFALQPESEPVVLLEGTHKLVIKGSNIEPYSEDITITSGLTQTIDLSNVKLKTGLLNLIVNEQIYELLIDGELFEQGKPIILDYGEHTIQLQKEDYEPVIQKIIINKAYSDLRVEFIKEIKLCRLYVETNPPGAEVYVDSAKIGNSPAEANLEYGNHTLHIRMEGYKEITIPVTIDKPDQPYLVNLQKIDPVTPDLPIQIYPSAQSIHATPSTQPVQTTPPEQYEQPVQTESSTDGNLATPTPQRWYIQG